MFAFYFTSVAIFFGAYVASSRNAMLVFPFVILAHVALIAVVTRSVRATRDVFNPALVVIALSVVRFTIPWAIATSGGDADNQLFQLLGVRWEQWQLGEAIAALGILAFSLGWLLLSDSWPRGGQLRVNLPAGTFASARLAMILGMVFLYLFVVGNVTSLRTVVATGTFRATEITEGTGIFFYLALLLIASSVVLSASSESANRGRLLRQILPALVAAAAYFVLGGRARAATPLAGALLVAWYMRRNRLGWHEGHLKKGLIAALVVAPVMLWLLFAGSLYRNQIATSVGDYFSPSGLERYVAGSFTVDIGQLHALAAASEIGPGALAGRTFIGVLTFPLSQFVDLPGQNSGVFIVSSTLGFQGTERWALAPSLMGDGYLNLGVPAVVLAPLLLGLLLKYLYVRFRQGRLLLPIFALAAVYGVRIMFESVDKWAEGLTVVGFCSLIILLGDMIPTRRRGAPLERAIREPTAGGAWSPTHGFEG